MVLAKVSLLQVSAVSIVLLAFGSFDTQSVFADHDITYQKVVDINKNSLLESFINLDVFSQIFPDNVKSVELLDFDDRNIAKMKLGINGFFINSKVEYVEAAEEHVIEIISGNLEGTKISTTLEETWGFDGSPNQGTIVNVDMDLQFSGPLLLLEMVSADSILYSIDYSLDKIVSYSKSEPDIESQNLETSDDTQKKQYKSEKKGRRTR